MLKLISPSQSELKLPIGPTKWIEGKGGEMVLLASGSEGGKQRRKELLNLETIWEDIAFFTPASKSNPSQNVHSETATKTASQEVSTEKVDPIPNGLSPPTVLTVPGAPVTSKA